MYALQYCKLQLAPANDTCVEFACIKKGFNKLYIGTFK